MKRLIFIMAIFLAINGANGQVSFNARTDAQQIVANTVAEVTFTLSNAKGQEFTSPKFDGLQVISGPNTSTSMSIINGKSTSSVSYRYTLLGKKVGSFIVGAATIKVGKSTYKTKPFNIKVVKGTAASQKAVEDKNNFVRLEVNDTTAVIGQQLVLDYVLYFQQDLSGYDILNESDYDGFFSSNVRAEDRATRRKIIDGEEYYVKTVKTVTLFPQRTGVFVIDPVIVDLSIPIPGQRKRSFFSSTPSRKQRVRTNKVNISVEDIPVPKPEFFSGAVGKYQMAASVNKNKVTTDDAIILTMEIRGNGDGKTVKAPVQPSLANLEYYDPNVIEDKDIREDGNIDNYKRIEYLIVPKKPGSYVIRPEFTYYDVDSNAYNTIRTRPTRVVVTQGTRTITNDDRDISIGTDLSPAKMQANTISAHMLNYADRVLFGACGLFLFGLGGIFWKRRQMDIEDGIDPAEKRKQAALKVAIAQLADAKSYLEAGDGRALYSEVSTAMNGFLANKYQVANSDLDKHKIKAHLEENGVDKSLIDEYLAILQKAEMAIFAGQSADGMQNIYDRSLRLIQTMAIDD